jgi:hypothetical protein
MRLFVVSRENRNSRKIFYVHMYHAYVSSTPQPYSLDRGGGKSGGRRE